MALSLFLPLSYNSLQEKKPITLTRTIFGILPITIKITYGNARRQVIGVVSTEIEIISAFAVTLYFITEKRLNISFRFSALRTSYPLQLQVVILEDINIYRKDSNQHHRYFCCYGPNTFTYTIFSFSSITGICHGAD